MSSGRTVAQILLIAYLTTPPGPAETTLADVGRGRVRAEAIVEAGAEPTSANVSLAEGSAVSRIAPTAPPTVVAPPASVTQAVPAVVRVF